jgi:hypothetical protein
VWSGTAQSWVDLNPPGASSSEALAVSGNQQAGSAYFGGYYRHAGIWSGTAASWIDLQPSGVEYGNSAVFATTGTQQAGCAYWYDSNHAGIWSGSAASFIDLHPYEASNGYSAAFATTGAHQVGHAATTYNYTHAIIWAGSRESAVDLHSFLSPYYQWSTANGIWEDSSGIYVVGRARNGTTGIDEAILWFQAVPEPGSLVALECGLAVLARRRRRCR